MIPPLPILAIAGPTASGKSALALEICARLASGEGGFSGAEIVSVDSAQVYRGMDIGTAKPDAATRARVPHHLLDVIDPAQSYSAARFAVDARAHIAQIRARGHVPVLVGGTMLYFRALLQGLSDLPPADAQTRAQITAQATTLGWAEMHRRLGEIDPVTAARLHPNDAQRIQRALEIFAMTGVAPSAGYAKRESLAPLTPIIRIAIVPANREVLHRRIESRFCTMMDQGFLGEVAALRARGDLHAELPAIRAVGYRQLWSHLTGSSGLDEAIEAGIAATRQYAKRQLTWLRAESDWTAIDPPDHDANASGNGTKSASEILRALERLRIITISSIDKQ